MWPTSGFVRGGIQPTKPNESHEWELSPLAPDVHHGSSELAPKRKTNAASQGMPPRTLTKVGHIPASGFRHVLQSQIGHISIQQLHIKALSSKHVRN